MFEDRSVTADQDVLEVVRRVLADPRHIRVQSGLIGFVANSSCKFHESLTICPMSREESVAARIAHPDRIQDLTEGAPVDDGLANLDHKRLDGFHLLTGSGREQSPPHSARSIVGEHIRPPLGSPNRCLQPTEEHFPELNLLGLSNAGEDRLLHVLPLGVCGLIPGGHCVVRGETFQGRPFDEDCLAFPDDLVLELDHESVPRNEGDPIVFFRFHTSYAVVTCPSSSLSSGKFRWYLSLNFTWLFVSSRLTPRTTAP